MNRVFYAVWGIMALMTMYFDIQILSNKFTWLALFGAFFQAMVLVFIITQYWKLDREAARRRRQVRRSKRFAERYARRDTPFKMPKVGEK